MRCQPNPTSPILSGKIAESLSAMSIERGMVRHVSDARIDYRDELPEAIQPEIASHEIPDDRLKLMFVCAHPAIDARIHTPLML